MAEVEGILPEAVTAGNSNSESPYLPGFQLLPQEIRDLIWEFSLPSERVFQVAKTVKSFQEPDTVAWYIRCYIRHPPPSALGVCHASRVIALRDGFFLSSHGPDPGVWFNQASDVLYIDRNNRDLLRAPSVALDISGLDRVQNVGIEWRALVRDVPPRYESERATSNFWKRNIDAVCGYLPQLKTVTYVLPQVRHRGSMAFGREPHYASRYPALLVEMPDSTQIPWSSDRNRGPDAAGRHGLLAELESRSVTTAEPMLKTWAMIRDEIIRDVMRNSDGRSEWEEELDGAGEHGGPESRVDKVTALGFRPKLQGRWLLRPTQPTAESFDNPQIQRFDY